MNHALSLLAAALGAAAAFAAEPTITPALASANAPVALEKIMVTGSLADPAAGDDTVALEKIMVTGSLQDPTEAPVALEKIMVTGSLADPADAPVALEKIMVTGSLAPRPALKRVHTKR
ncbi:MAG TPA: hypothetical protein VGD81_16125 [Opitutaceae bacterium]